MCHIFMFTVSKRLCSLNIRRTCKKKNAPKVLQKLEKHRNKGIIITEISIKKEETASQVKKKVNKIGILA